MALNTQQFRLINDPFFGCATRQEPYASSQSNAEPEYSFLSVPIDGPTCLGLSKDGRPTLSANTPQLQGQMCYLESVYHSDRVQLIFLYPADSRNQVHGLKLNGQPAPLVALLGMGDQLQLGSHVLHVTVYNQPAIGPASSEVVGQECIYCRVPIAAEDLVYHCRCGAALHCESGEADPAADRLQCAQNVSVCPACQESIHLEEGYLYAPPV